MKKINLLIKESFSRKQLIINSLLIGSSILIVCQNSAFMFNPFILVLLCASYIVSFLSLCLVGLSIIITSFVISPTYGFELIFVVLIILIFHFLMYIIKAKRIRPFIVSILSIFTMFFIYLFTSKGSFYAINSLVLLIISLIYVLSFVSIIDKYKHKEDINRIELCLVFSFITSLFISIPSFMFVWVTMCLILLIKMEKFELYIFTTFASFILFYLFSNVAIDILLSIYISFFLVGLIKTKYSYFFFVPFLSLFMMSVNQSFYLDQTFYQLVIGYLIIVLFPSSIIDKMRIWVDYSTIDSLKDVVTYQNKKIEEIARLCTLLMDDRFDKVDNLNVQLEKTIKKEVCQKCTNFSSCSLSLSGYLNGYLSNSEKNEIVDKCLYPYQIQKSINVANKRIVDYQDREEKSIEARKIMNNTYQIIKKYIEISPSRSSKEKKYDLEVSKLSKEAESSPNGDSYEMFDDNYHTVMALSDGMGHTSKSKDISNYLIELVNYLFLISNKTSDAIESSNQILLAKTYEEVYATLDLCEFDLEKGKAFVYKAGSFPTYLIRNKTVKEISTKLPPIGIINNIRVEPEEIDIRHNDILVFLTDGFGENVKRTIEQYVQKANFLPLKNYAKFLFKKLNEGVLIEDDKTLVAIKINKS